MRVDSCAACGWTNEMTKQEGGEGGHETKPAAN